MLLGFFHILIGELLWGIGLLIFMLIRLLIEYWYITALVLICYCLIMYLGDKKIDKIIKSMEQSSQDEPTKTELSTTIRILKLYKGREIKLNILYIHRKLSHLEDLDASITKLVDGKCLTIETKYENTYYVITHEGIIERNKHLYKI